MKQMQQVEIAMLKHMTFLMGCGTNICKNMLGTFEPLVKKQVKVNSQISI